MCACARVHVFVLGVCVNLLRCASFSKTTYDQSVHVVAHTLRVQVSAHVVVVVVVVVMVVR